jgi:hypothetical protein
VHVSARREVAAIGGDDDGLDGVVSGERAECVAKLRIRVKREWVLPLGLGERVDSTPRTQRTQRELTL